MSEGTKSSPWQGRINSGASDASVILFIFSNFVCGAYRDQPCTPCTVTVWKLSANEVAIASDGVGMRLNLLFQVSSSSLPARVVQVYAIDKLEQDSDPITLHK